MGDRRGEGNNLWNMSLPLDMLGNRMQAIAHAPKDAALEPAYLSVSQVAEQLNVTTRTVERMVKRGDFPRAYKLPGETAPYLIPREAVESYLEKKRPQSQD